MATSVMLPPCKMQNVRVFVCVCRLCSLQSAWKASNNNIIYNRGCLRWRVAFCAEINSAWIALTWAVTNSQCSILSDTTPSAWSLLCGGFFFSFSTCTEHTAHSCCCFFYFVLPTWRSIVENIMTALQISLFQILFSTYANDAAT